VSRPRLILHCLDGLGIGGAERQLVLLLRHIPREMFEHVVCHVGSRRDLVPEVEALGVPVYDLSRRGRISVLHGVRRLGALIRELRPDLLHADHVYGKLCARIARTLYGVPVLTTTGNVVAGRRPLPDGVTPRQVRLWTMQWTHSMAARLMTDHFMAIAHAVKETMILSGLPRRRISVVYRGIDLEEFVVDPPERIDGLRGALGLEGVGPILLNVGRLVEQKGQDDIIRALPAVRRHYPGVRVLLAGDGRLRDAYAALAEREGVADAVLFLGVRPDIRPLLQLADVFVFPSRFEGTGIALLEAMALARPCVVSQLPVLAEVMGTDGAGVLVPPYRPDLLARALSGLLGDPAQRRRMGERSRKIVERRFDIRKNALDFAALCTRVIEARRRGRATGPSPDGSIPDELGIGR
jgi:glycosyltransferase involved in cell wall biosynthesis